MNIDDMPASLIVPSSLACNSLTKREWFAGMALQGAMSNYKHYYFTMEVICKLSFDYADAMIAESRKEKS